MSDMIRPDLPPQGGCGCEDPTAADCLEGMSLAMVYSPCQQFDGLYTPEKGLQQGTIFAELDKPFWGARRLK
jgi:hypothetical protein